MSVERLPLWNPATRQIGRSFLFKNRKLTALPERPSPEILEICATKTPLVSLTPEQFLSVSPLQLPERAPSLTDSFLLSAVKAEPSVFVTPEKSTTISDKPELKPKSEPERSITPDPELVERKSRRRKNPVHKPYERPVKRNLFAVNPHFFTTTKTESPETFECHLELSKTKSTIQYQTVKTNTGIYSVNQYVWVAAVPFQTVGHASVLSVARIDSIGFHIATKRVCISVQWCLCGKGDKWEFSRELQGGLSHQILQRHLTEEELKERPSQSSIHRNVNCV